MRVALIGSGNIAKLHGHAILEHPTAELVGVLDVIAEKAESLANSLSPQVRSFHDFDAMLADVRPEVIHILTPPPSHGPLAIQAMKANCHVMVEKPMAMTTAEARHMIEIADSRKVSLCVDHNLLFEEPIRELKSTVAKGIIGEVVSVDSSFRFDPRRYPAMLEEGADQIHWIYTLNGGPLQDLLPHPASLLVEFMGDIDEVQSLSFNRGVLPQPWPDELRILLRSGRTTGHISLSLVERPDTINLTVRGTHGSIQADLFGGVLILQRKSRLPRAIARGFSGLNLSMQSFGASMDNIKKFVRGRIDKSSGIQPLIHSFYSAITHGLPLPVSPSKSLQVVELMETIWPKPLKISPMKKTAHSVSRQTQNPIVLVTGASGFIGYHLVLNLLEKNMNVRALVRPDSLRRGRLEKLGIEIIEGDLTNQHILYQAAKGVEKIYHAGASTSSDWQDQEAVTLKGTENLIQAALTQNVDRFIHFSTLAVYELLNVNNNKKIKEDSPYQQKPKQMGPYAYAKIEAEKRVFEAYRKQGLGVTVVRPGMVIGPLGRVFFPHLGYRYQDIIFCLIGKGDVKLPFTYVENTVDGIWKVSNSDRAIGQAYNLVDDGEITARDYLERFIRITGTQARIIVLPYIFPYFATGMYEIASKFDLLKKGITSRAQLKWKQSRVRFDNTKAKHELGWAPTISIEDGLDKTFQWYASKYGSD